MSTNNNSNGSNNGGEINNQSSSGCEYTDPIYDVNVNMLANDLGKTPLTLQQFMVTFEGELNRAVKSVNDRQKSLELDDAKPLLNSVEVHLSDLSSKNGDEAHTRIYHCSQRVHDYMERCVKLQECATANRQALLRIATRADELFQNSAFTNLVQSAFPGTLNSVLVVIASDLYQTIRTATQKLNDRSNSLGSDGVWKAPTSFQRNTTKYWIKEEHLTKVLMTCASETPLLVYGKKGRLTPKSPTLMPSRLIPTRMTPSKGDILWKSLTTPIQSVYFDSPAMDLYKRRLARFEGAQLLRARWYGTTMPKGNGIIFLELKTHHEKWVAQKSVKERVAVQERDMMYVLEQTPWTAPNQQQARAIVCRGSPNISGDELAKSTNLLTRMHNLVVQYNLRSCVRSVYMRAAFQSAKSNDLRITLDRNVTLIDETRREGPLDKSWCLSDEEANSSENTVVVPFEVFEVKLVGDNPMPQSLARLIETGVIEEAPKFSKFLSGVASFNRVPTFPYWAKNPAFKKMFHRTLSQEFLSTQDQSSPMDPCDCYQLFNGDTMSTSKGSTSTSVQDILGSDVAIAEKNPARVEPKSYFANERTFIQWISASLLLLTISTIVMADGQFMRTAAMIGLTSLFLVTYSTYIFFRRIKLLSSGKGYGYIDHYGPAVLAIGVGIGTLAVFWDIVAGKDIFGEQKRNNDKSSFFSSYYDRRLMASDKIHLSSSASLFGSGGKEHVFACQTSLSDSQSFNLNDVDVDSSRDLLLIASASEILGHPFSGGYARHLAHVDDAELFGLVSVNSDRVLAVSGGPIQTTLLDFAWDNFGNLEKQGSWIVSDHMSVINGFEVVDDGQSQTLYIGIDGLVHSYQVPQVGETSLSRVDGAVIELVERGLCPDDCNISFQFFEGTIYFFNSKGTSIHAWDMSTGQYDVSIQLPSVDHDPLGKWTGFTFERRPSTNTTGSGLLRGWNVESHLFLHMTLDHPSEVWTFSLDESTGSFSVLECVDNPSIKH